MTKIAIAPRPDRGPTHQGPAPDAALQPVQHPADQSFVRKAREDLAAYLAETGKRQAEVARAIGISDTALSQVLSGKYPGAATNVARRIAAWLALEARRIAAPPDPLWVETKAAAEILTVLRWCHESCDLGMIYGAAGSGKTRTAQQYKAENPDVILITATEAIRSPRPFLRHLAQLENVKAPISGALDAVFDGLLARLRRSGRLLVVDEAQKLSFRALELVRSLHDLGGIGVVLMGDEVLWRRLYEGRTQTEHERLVSRIGIRRCLRPDLPRGDVEKVARQYINGADQECVAYLHARAQGVGGLRAVTKLCRLAFRFTAKADRAVTVQDLERAVAMLGA